MLRSRQRTCEGGLRAAFALPPPLRDALIARRRATRERGPVLDSEAVRLAGPSDALVLARLRYEFRASVNEAVEGEEAFVERCRAWMEARLAGPSWRCWVVEEGGAIAGHLWLQLVEKIPNPAPELEAHAYITNVYVRPAARANGAGARLLEAAMGWCRESGIDSVILWPTPRSRTLYARHGFSRPDDIMEAVVDPGRDLGHPG